MAYSSETLITKSFYLSGIVSQQLEVITGDQISEGLDLLNALLAIKSANLDFITYFQEYQLTAVPGQEKYFIPNLIFTDSITFNIGVVRYAMSPQSRKQYFGSGRVDNIETLPFNWRMERAQGGSNIYLYYLPAGNYPLKIWGKFALTSVTLNQDLALTLDYFYIEYLRYELAQYMCSEYTISFAPESMATLKKYRKVVNQVSTPDMTISKLSCFKKSPGLTWADVNLGVGWRPT